MLTHEPVAHTHKDHSSMAYRRKTSSRRPRRGATARRASYRPARRSTRRVSSGNRRGGQQTVRLVIQQAPTPAPISNPLVDTETGSFIKPAALRKRAF